MIKAWVNDLNVTSFRILISCLIAASLSHIIVIAMVFYSYTPTPTHITVLTGLLFGLLTMMGFETISLLGKRWTDIDYTRAKNPPTQVIAPPPSTVTVEGDAVVHRDEPPHPTEPAPPPPTGPLTRSD